MGRERRLILYAAAGFTLLLLVGSFGAGAQETEVQRLIDDFLETEHYFRVFVEQEGQVATASEGVVSLDRKPFTLVLFFRDASSSKNTSAVLANFSFKNVICSGFRQGKSLGEFLDNPDNFMGMAEHIFNAEEKIVVDEVVPHYLYYDASDNHRFSSVTQRDGVLVCRRRIAHYSYLESIEQKSPVEQIQWDKLYISLLYSQYGKNYQRIEKQRACLEIKFLR